RSNADLIEGMEVQGLAIPAHGKSPGAATSRRELRRRSRASHPHFNIAQARGFDPASTLMAMDIEGIDVAVMYGTRGRQILCHDDLAPDYAAALARAYNSWAHDYCSQDPQRLKFAAQIAMHDIPSAVAEARRCVTELGAVAIIGTPNPVNGQHLHDEVCEPLCPSDRHDGATRRCRAALCRTCQFSPDSACDPQSGRANGGYGKHDQWRCPRAASEAALRLSRRDGWVALLVALAAR